LFIYAPGPSSKAWGIKSVYFQRTVWWVQAGHQHLIHLT
jgi:hypothetical protein